jgi:hypothetical protein
MRRSTTALVLAIAAGVLCVRPAVAQPTYKLGVKPDLKPLATLKFDGDQLKRSDLSDDPGFRMQYHFKKDGKSAAEVEARATPELKVPLKEAGTYTVVLELFYPAYKGGGAQKGEFKAVSNVLTFKWEPGARPDQPGKITLIEPPPETPKK